MRLYSLLPSTGVLQICLIRRAIPSNMRSAVLLSLSSLAASAALDRRDAVPPGYVAPSYYPSKPGIVHELSSQYGCANMDQRLMVDGFQNGAKATARLRCL